MASLMASQLKRKAISRQWRQRPYLWQQPNNVKAAGGCGGYGYQYVLASSAAK